MARHPKITRLCPGRYTVTYGDYVVAISRIDNLNHEYGTWVVSAVWDTSIHSDPIVYLADAKQCAREMIDDACDKHEKPLISRNS